MINGSRGNPDVVAISVKVQITAVSGSDNLRILQNTVSGLWSTGQGAGVAKTFVNHPKPPTFYYLYLNSKSQELSPLKRMWRSANQVKKREEIGINDNPIILC